MADLALELARAVQRRALEALAEPPTEKRPAGPDPVVAFARAARAVRLSVHLQARLEAEVKTLRQAAEARAETRAARPTPLAERKEEIAECVGQVIDAEIEDGRETRIAYLDLLDRLESEEDEGRLLDRPISVVIADICAELGLIPDWSLWADEDWAIEETRAATAGSPYAAPPYRNPDEAPDEAEPPPERLKIVSSLGP